MAAEPQLTEDQVHKNLCEDSEYAKKYGFIGENFVKNQSGRIHDDSPQLDLRSIMMYPSTAAAKDGCPQDKMACPLLKYPPPEYQFGNVKIPELIQSNRSPSDGDIAWLKQYYPHEN